MHVTHIAWLGHRNFGDDVMAHAVRQWLAARCPKTQYTVWCEGKPATDDRVRWIYPYQLDSSTERAFFEQQALRETDMLLIGGGSILHSQHSIGWKQKAIDSVRRFNPDAGVLGINLSVGPFKDREAEDMCSQFLRSLDRASFRDVASYEFAMQQRDRLPYAPILAFDLAASYVEQCGISRRSMCQQVRTVGVSPRAPEDPKGPLFERYTRLLQNLAARCERVHLFAFCTSKQFGDGEYVKALVERVAAANLQSIPYDGDPFRFTQQLRECDFLVAERLHGAVMGFVLNIPVLCVSYHKKCEDFARFVGLPETLVQRRAAFSPAEVLEQIRPYALPDQNPFVELSKRNFAVFDRILE